MDTATTAHGRYHALLQLIAGKTLDGAHGAHAAFEHREGHGARNLREFFDDQQRLEVTKAQTTVLLGDIDAEKAHRPIFVDEFMRRRFAGFLDLFRQRRQPLPGVLARCFLEGLLLVSQLEVHELVLVGNGLEADCAIIPAQGSSGAAR
jgi:hypothetical protein